jgi:hypothetical protein
MDQQMEFELRDEDTSKGPSLKGMIQVGTGTVMIHFDGYGDGGSPKGDGFPVGIMWQGGELKVFVWGDINSDEATHKISLEGAREK